MTVHRNSIKTDLAFGTEQELSAAQIFIDKQYPGGIAYKLPGYSDLDFIIIVDGKVKAFIEIKTRRNKTDEYDSTILPLRKHTIAKEIQQTLRVPVYAVISFTDGVVSFRLDEDPDNTAYVKRSDRNNGSQHVYYSKERFVRH